MKTAQSINQHLAARNSRLSGVQRTRKPIERNVPEHNTNVDAANAAISTPSSGVVDVRMLGVGDVSPSAISALSSLLTPSRTIVAMKGSRDDPLTLIPTKPHPRRREDHHNDITDAPPPPPYYGLPAFQLLCNLEILPSTSPSTITTTTPVLIADQPSLPSILQSALLSKRYGGGGVLCAIHGPFGCHCGTLKSIGKAVCSLRAEFRLTPSTAMLLEEGTPRFSGYDIPLAINKPLCSEVSTMMMMKSGTAVMPSEGFADRILDVAASCTFVGYGGTVLFFTVTKPSSTMVVAVVVIGCSADLPLPSTRRLLGPFSLGPNESRDHVLSSLNAPHPTTTHNSSEDAGSEVVEDCVPLKVPQCIACSARGVSTLVPCVGCKEFLCCPQHTTLSSFPSDYQSPTPAKQHKIPSAWVRHTPPSSKAATPSPASPHPTSAPVPPTTFCARQCLYCPSGSLCCQRCANIEYSTALYQRVFVCTQSACQAQHREMERLAEFNH